MNLLASCQLLVEEEDADDVDSLRQTEDELRLLDNFSLSGARVRCQIQWLDEREVPGEQRGSKPSILVLLDNNGDACRTQSAKLEAAAAFYDRLFCAELLRGR